MVDFFAGEGFKDEAAEEDEGALLRVERVVEVDLVGREERVEGLTEAEEAGGSALTTTFVRDERRGDFNFDDSEDSLSLSS